MRKIRGILSIFMVIAIVACLGMTSFAATLTQDNPTADVPVVYKAGTITDEVDANDPTDDIVEGTFVVTIPDYIEVAEMGGTITTYNVTASEVLIPYGTNLTVNVAFTGKVALKDHSEATLAYDMQNNGAKIASGDTILTVAAGNPDATSTTPIGAILTEKALYAGTYLDTATFTVAVA